MADRDLSLALRIKALVEGVKDLNSLRDGIKGVGKQAEKQIPDPTPRLREGLGQTNKAIGDVKRELTGLLSVAALGRFVTQSVDAVRKVDNAFRGLEAVANHTGVGIEAAWARVTQLTEDGLLTVADAAKALQNLLSRGYTVDEAVTTLNRLKDAAAFNRSAHLSLSEAVVTASEGLKNENSILVDNAGVTKNVSVLWKEYAQEIGVSVNNLTQQQKIQAEVNGILRETAAQVGNAAQAAAGAEGDFAKLNKASKELQTTLGDALLPVLTQLAKMGTFITNSVLKPAIGLVQSFGVYYAAGVETIRDIFTLDWDEIADNYRRAGEQVDDIFAAIKQTSTQATSSIKNDTKAMAEARYDAAKIGGQAAKLQTKQEGKLLKKLQGITESLRDQIELFKKQKKALEAAKKNQADFLQTTADAQAALNGIGAAEPEAPGVLDIADQISKANSLLKDGDYQEAQAAAEATFGMIQAAGEAGTAAKLTLNDYFKTASNIGGDAAQGIVDTEEQALETVQATITELVAEAEKLKGIQVGLDTEAAIAQADQLRATLEAKFKENPLVIPVTLGKPPTGKTQPDVISLAPGKAAGGPIRGPGTGTSDDVLLYGSNGEYMIKSSAVKHYGEGAMDAINQMRAPRFATGGLVSARRTQNPVASSSQNSRPLNLYLDGRRYTAATDATTAKEMHQAFGRESMKRGYRG